MFEECNEVVFPSSSPQVKLCIFFQYFLQVVSSICLIILLCSGVSLVHKDVM